MKLLILILLFYFVQACSVTMLMIQGLYDNKKEVKRDYIPFIWVYLVIKGLYKVTKESWNDLK